MLLEEEWVQLEEEESTVDGSFGDATRRDRGRSRVAKLTPKRSL